MRIVALLVLLFAAPLAAQEAAPPPAWNLALTGAAGAGAGFLAGRELGRPLNAEACSDCWGTTLGGFVGLSVGSPLGVHLADGRRGNAWAVLGGSVLAGLGAAMLAERAGADETAARVTLPLAQLAAAVGIELWTRR